MSDFFSETSATSSILISIKVFFGDRSSDKSSTFWFAIVSSLTSVSAFATTFSSARIVFALSDAAMIISSSA